MLDWLIKKFRAKDIKKHNGMVIFYTVYKPQNAAPNVISHCLDPEIQKDEELNELLKQVAEKVRSYYEGKPELLEEILKSVK